jgi:ATP-dependent helicase HrpB
LDWLTPPPKAALNAANSLLDRLEVTPEMASLPLAPRLAKLVTHAKRDAPESACAVAAILSTGERGSPDLFTLIDSDWQPQTRRVFEQLRRFAPGKDRSGHDALLASILAAFPDRVARHRRDGELLLSSGGSAKFPGCRDEFVIVLDIEDRREHGLPLVRLAVAIEPELLLEHAASRTTLEWNRQAERVEAVNALVYDQLVIEETRAPAAPSEAASRLLFSKAREVDIGRFADADELAQLRERAAFAGIEIDVDSALERLCAHCISLAEVTAAGLLEALRPKNLNQLAPERLRLPGGREVKVHYDPGKPPWIESRLQDFFGVRETPRIGNTPVVVHLLAPNHRPVQVTQDLAGFWERLYPQVRKELSRRYPKHKWPERPG